MRSSSRELVRRLSELPGAGFAALLIAPPPDEFDHSRPHRVVIAGGDLPCARWDDLSSRADYLLGLAETGDVVPIERSVAELRSSGLPPVAFNGSDGWLLTPVLSGPGLVVLLLLGYRHDNVDVPGLWQALLRIAHQIRPLVDARVRIGLLRDEVEALKNEKEGLTRLNRMQGEFVAVASHELKTPLTSIIAYSEVLCQQADRGNFPEAEEFTHVIHEEGERLLRMVNRILDFSQLEFGSHVLSLIPGEMKSLIDDAATTLRPVLVRKQQRLVINHGVDLPRVDMDEDLIRQALVNLVNNASKYSPTGGCITISTVEEAASVRLCVSDTGQGIPADQVRKIFRQFYRLEAHLAEEGAGLGLTIVKHIINLHGGQIDVRSELGEGAEFSFSLRKEHCFDARPVAGLGERSKPLDYREVLRLSTLLIAEMMASRKVAILFPDESGERLIVHSSLGLNVECFDCGVDPRQSSLVAQVLTSCENGLDHSPASDDPLTAAGMRASRAAVPLLIDETSVRGVVVVSGKTDGRPYSADDVALLSVIGRNVSAALTILGAEKPGSKREVDLLVALRTLAHLRRDRIPTASPLALRLVGRTGAALGLSSAGTKTLQYVSSLHDAGMVQIDEEIVLKVGDLDEDERDVVDQHPMSGVKLMAPLLPTPEMREIIISHHEWMDGTGYPEGRRGEEIPLGARILAVVDAFFAMIMARPYRADMPPPKVAGEIRAMAGTQFDPVVVDAFLSVLVAEGILNPTADLSGGPGDEKESRWQPQES